MKKINLTEANEFSYTLLMSALENVDLTKALKRSANMDLIDCLIMGALYSYHNQLREILLEYNIDIGSIQVRDD